MTVTLREPSPEDAPETAAVRLRGWRATYTLTPERWARFTPQHFEERDAEWISSYVREAAAGTGRRRARVAHTEDGRIVGVAVAGPAQLVLPEPEADLALFSLYVDPDSHGRGIGSALIEAVLPRQERAVLEVSEPNPVAQAFYRRHGFSPIGTPREHEELGILVRRMARLA